MREEHLNGTLIVSHLVTANWDRSLIQIEGVNDTKAAKLVYAITLVSIKSNVLIVSILARRSPLSTVHSEKFEGQRSESSGVKSLGHMVRAAQFYSWWRYNLLIMLSRKCRCSAGTVQE